MLSTTASRRQRATPSRFALLAVIVLAIAPAHAALNNGWTVFQRATPNATNLLQNPGFESGSGSSATNWDPFGAGYSREATGAHSGTQAIRLTNTLATDVHGASQTIVLNQTAPRALYLAGWSRASTISGARDNDYAIYLDIFYTDGSPLYGQTLTFAAGTHDWEFRERTIIPEKPIASISFYTLLRGGHTGSAWFDDLELREYPASAAVFDSQLVVPPATSPDLTGAVVDSLTTGDGLTLGLTREGGAIASLTLDGTNLVPAARGYTGGLFVRDRVTNSDFMHFGGTLASSGSTLTQTDAGSVLNLSLSAMMTAQPGQITINGSITDLSNTDRGVTVYFALPHDPSGWVWGDALRRSRVVAGAGEFRNTTLDGFQDGPLSPYPWSAVTGLVTSAGQASGLSLAYALDLPAQVRIVCNPATRQLYLAYDLALTAESKMPRRATYRFSLFKHQSAWPFAASESRGFRAAAQRYYELFPAWFQRRVPPSEEGIWIAFTDLSLIPGLPDFGVEFHEADLWAVPFDDAHGVRTLRYVSEPWSYHMPILDATDPNNYAQVIAYLNNQYQTGTGRARDMAEATLSSGTFDEQGRYRFQSENVPWCNNSGKCVVFTLNADPDVSVPPYLLNKAKTDWNPTVWGAYDANPTLDGEYIDSFYTQGGVANYRRQHFGAADLPLLPSGPSSQPAIAEVQSTYEFSRAIASDIHGRGKWMMANTILLNIPWGAELFDVAGTEVNWYGTGSWQPPADEWFLYKRALMHRKPYGTLMNMDFSNLTFERSEQYMQISLFYGIYASMFSADASTNAYWTQPALYERDRPLFKKYVPLVRTLNQAGWQPLSHATSSHPAIYVERYGHGNPLYLTLRNDGSNAAAGTVTLNTTAVGLLGGGRLDIRDQIGAGIQQIDYSGESASIPVTLPAQGVQMLRIAQTSPAPIPDGRWVLGTELTVARAGGAALTVRWDATHCPPPGTHLVWYDLAGIAAYSIKSVTCASGNSGSWTGTPPAGNLAVLVVGDDRATLEGSYGADSRRIERPSSTTACGLSAKRLDATCP